MIRFRQKEYIAPVVAGAAAATGGLSGMGLMNALTAGSLGLGVLQMGQASSQAKEAEKQQQEALAVQKRENAKLTKALDRLAKSSQGNPQVLAQAGQLVGKSKTFSVNSKFVQNATGFIKGVISSVGKGTKEVVKNGVTKVETTPTGLGKIGRIGINMATAGAATAGVGYGVDKLITSDARKTGIMLPPSQKSYSIMSQVGTYAKKGLKYMGSKENLKTAAGWAIIPAGFTAGGYLMSKNQYKDQVNNQQNITDNQLQSQQKSYSSIFGNGLRTAKQAAKNMWKNSTKNWKGWETVTGAISNASTFGMAGRRDVQGFAKRLQDPSKGSWANALGRGMEKHKNLANLGTAAIGGTLIGGTYNLGDKIVRKSLEGIDKNAFAYEKHNNQQTVQ